MTTTRRMMRAMIALAICGALAPSAASASVRIAGCNAATPRVGGGGIDDTLACVADFSTSTGQQVTTRIEPGTTFAGWALLRVRGPNALWTEYDGYFVGGNLVVGAQTSTFWLAPGDWQIEVYVGENAGTIFSVHRNGVGNFGGSVYES